MGELSMSKKDPWVGQTIEDRYQITRYIDAGGMGVVYEGRDRVLERRVAIKRLHGIFAKDQGALKRFRREAQAATKIGNEHIIQVYDMVFPENLPPFMVLEYLDGVTLEEDIIDNEPQPLGRIARLIIQICDALEEVHNARIIHRDLKPGNIFLISQGANPDFVKVLDFGVAMVKSSVAGQGTKLTNPGQPIGTLEYMSPEQVEGRVDIDWRTDIYALGAILYFSLAASPPLSADSIALLMKKICEDPIPSIRKWRTDLPDEVDRIISKAMAKNREDRFGNARELKSVLWPYLDQPLQQFSTPPPSALSLPPEGQPDTRRWAMPVAILGAIIAAVALVVSLIMDRTDEPQTDQYMISPARPEPGVVSAKEEGSTLNVEGKEVPSLVQINVTTIPSQAKLYLDERAVSNPYRGTLAVDGEKHVLKAVLSGYQDKTEYLAPLSDEKIVLRLQPHERAHRGITSTQHVSDSSEKERPSISQPSGSTSRQTGSVLSNVESVVKEPTSTAPAQPVQTPSVVHPSEKKPASSEPTRPIREDLVPRKRKPLEIKELP